MTVHCPGPIMWAFKDLTIYISPIKFCLSSLLFSRLLKQRVAKAACSTVGTYIVQGSEGSYAGVEAGYLKNLVQKWEKGETRNLNKNESFVPQHDPLPLPSPVCPPQSGWDPRESGGHPPVSAADYNNIPNRATRYHIPLRHPHKRDASFGSRVCPTGCAPFQN